MAFKMSLDSIFFLVKDVSPVFIIKILSCVNHIIYFMRGIHTITQCLQQQGAKGPCPPLFSNQKIFFTKSSVLCF